MQLAPQCPEIDFLIIGSSCAAFVDSPRPANVGLLGEVDDETKHIVLSLAQIALNPMRTGSGTNLKMLEYAAGGVPILTTEMGLRGLDFCPEKEVAVAPLEDFAAGIARLRAMSQADLEQLTGAARKRAESSFDWRQIARRFLKNISATRREFSVGLSGAKRRLMLSLAGGR